MQIRKTLPFFVAGALLASALLVAACDGELSDGLPETIESSGDSCNTCHQSPPAKPHAQDDRCYACHGATVGADGQTIAGGAHLNEQVDFDIAGCDICHAYPPAAPHPEVTVCAPCHGATVTADETLDWDSGNHANGKLDVAITEASCSLCHGYPPAEPHPQEGACATCHGKTVGPDGMLLSDSDAHANGSVELEVGEGASCTGCHGYPPALPHPGEAACSQCHATAIDDEGNLLGNKHLNGTADLKLTSGSCGKCHAMPPEEGHPPADNCVQCHGCVVDEELDFVYEKLHMNGQVDFASPPNCP